LITKGYRQGLALAQALKDRSNVPERRERGSEIESEVNRQL
jgi:hypothetical protein